jgi:hypothetical protein
MAVKANLNRKVWIDGFHVSCDLNRTEVTRRVEPLDITSFCSSGRRRIAGLQDFSVNLTGYFNNSTGNAGYSLPSSAQIEPAAFNRLLAKSSAVVLIAESTAAGAACYIGRGAGAEVGLAGAVGSVRGITAVAQGNGPLINGRLLEYGNLSTAGFTANIVDLAPLGVGVLGVTTKATIHAAVCIQGSTGAAGVAKMISVQGNTDVGFTGTISTLFKWTVAQIDNTTSPGTAKYATTKVSSTKLRYVRITQKSSGGSTKAFFRMAIAVGVGRK